MPRRYWGRSGAGIAYVCREDETVMLVERSSFVNEPRTWATPGGAVERGEAPFDAAMRELREELGIDDPPLGQGIVHTCVWRDGRFEYRTFVVAIPLEQKRALTPRVRLNWECSAFGWFDPNDLPSPLHFGVRAMADVLAIEARKRRIRPPEP